MKTSRLKNIVIVILLLVNAFLLFLLLSRRAEERDSNERRVEQLCTLFEKNGVAFDRALLPDEEAHLSLSLERDAAREEAFASALLGTAESSDSGGGVSRFTGEYGSCSIRSGGTADALLSQLPLTLEVEDFSDNEKVFYPPEELDVTDAPLAETGEAGTLAYYEPWGDVVMFYGPFSPNGALYELGRAVVGEGVVSGLSGTIEVVLVE